MSNRTRILIIATVTVVLAIGVGVLVNNITKNVSSDVQEKNNIKNSANIMDKYIENNNTKDDEEEINEIDNNTTEQNVIQENKVEEQNATNNVENQTIGKEEEETQKEIEKEEKNNTTKSITEKEAINLVKKEWGEDDTVYFTVANKDSDNYYISVNDNSTTSVLSWYTVNIKTGEVSEN